MPKRRGSTQKATGSGKSSKVTRIKKHKTREEEFELLLRTAARLKAATTRVRKKESAA